MSLELVGVSNESFSVSGHVISSSTMVSNTSRLSCISLCYFTFACSSLHYIEDGRTCILEETVHAPLSSEHAGAPFEYFIWTLGSECPRSYIWFRRFQFCFKVYTETKSWSDAEEHCVQDGGHLIIADQPDVMYWLFTQAQRYDRYLWVGASENDDGWSWVGSNTTFSPQWGGSQPDGGQHCMIVVHFKESPLGFHDRPCSRNDGFVCQIETSVSDPVCQ